MKILFCGDVVGRSGREAVLKSLGTLKNHFDCIIVNGENAAHGFGITESIAKEFFKAGVHVITLGNHSWDQKETLSYIQREPRLLRPLNYPPGTPGNGEFLFTTVTGKKVLVFQVMGRLFMPPCDDPFRAAADVLKRYKLGQNVDAIFVDIHAEATSEKVAMAHFLDGQVSAVIGSHTHIPTADHRILEKGTGFQSDAGMCGDYNSVVGMKKHVAVERFTRAIPTERLSPAEGEGTFCGVGLELSNGLATKIYSIRQGGTLASSTIPLPELS